MKDQIIAYLKAGYPCLNLVTAEEHRAIGEISAAADATKRTLYHWSCTTGIMTAAGAPLGKEDPEDMLAEFTAMAPKSVLIARDLHAFLREPYPKLVRRLREALFSAKQHGKAIIVTGSTQHIPADLQKEITVLEFRLPGPAQLREVLHSLLTSAKKAFPDPTREAEILRAAGGLTTTEAENAFALSLVKHGEVVPKVVASEKAQTVKKNGLLEIFDSNLDLDSIGGLEELKDWLRRRRACAEDDAREYGLKFPKGALFFGPPGTGKSLTAKAVANILGGLPLLRCDAGAIFGSMVGQSEQNMRAVIQTAEAVAPCVLWFDEIDKGFTGTKSSGSTDGGTGARVFATLLQWMNDKTAPVFVVATANHPTMLDSALLRKGRWDELFFVDLPNELERRAIWQIQIARSKRAPENFDIPALSVGSAGFTGAEIETVVGDAMFNAFSDGKREFTTGDLLVALGGTTPVSKMMAEEIRAMRDWANGRARLASKPEKVTTLGRALEVAA